MWRFKPSKYKNAAPKVSPRQEGWITEISVTTPNSCGNHIQASAAFCAFNIDSGGGGSLGIVPLKEFGSQRSRSFQLNAHGDAVTDFEFCPYDDGILATGSLDQHVKLWRISPDGSLPSNPLSDIQIENGVEVVRFSPAIDCILSTADDKQIRIWDVNLKEQLYTSSHDDSVQGLSWKGDGKLLASHGRDKCLRIWDPRQPEQSQVAKSHSNNRDARVVWLGDSNHVLTTGFGSGRERELIIRDIKKLDEPLFTTTDESSLGVWIPLYDPDTNMLFLVGKADTAISFNEVMNKDPFFQMASKYMGNTQAKGAALVPKRGLNVMQGEVNKVLLLGSNCVVPVSYIVPRKSYRDFHSDLFPETRCPEPTMTVSDWKSGDNIKPNFMSLDPSTKKSVLKFNHELGHGPSKISVSSKEKNKSFVEKETEVIVQREENVVTSMQQQVSQSKDEISQKPLIAPKPASPRLVPRNVPSSTVSNVVRNFAPASLSTNNENKETPKPKQSPSQQRPVRSFGIRASKFRHLNGTVLQNETSFSDVGSLTRTVPGESNGFTANEKFIALPLGANGSLIAILSMGTSGRAPSLADIPGILCGTKCMDFTWDPFDSHRLVTGCDTGDIQVWNIPEKIDQKLSEPQSTFRSGSDKVNIVKFHPCARDVLCSAGTDYLVRVWDVVTMKEAFCLTGHTDQVLALAWSPNGEYLVTVCKDLKVRLYNPRADVSPIKIGNGPEGIRGARVTWVLGGTHFVVSGFSKVSERQVYLYDCQDIGEPIGSYGLDVCPSTLIPHYDEGSSTLFLTGKGDSTVYAFEVATDSPFFHPLSHYKCSGPHQSLSFLPKFVCNVKEVEFARALRLTTSTIETLSFYVPRLRTEFFQDDLFPNARVTWEPVLSSEEWISGVNRPSKFVSLQPSDMSLLSEAPPPVKNTTNKKRQESIPVQSAVEGEGYFEGSLAFLHGSKEKEKKIMQSMNAQCVFQQAGLPQDSFDGVDPEEWDEEEEIHAQQNQ